MSNSKYDNVRVGTVVKKTNRPGIGVMRLSVLDTGRKCRCGRAILVSTATPKVSREKKTYCSKACSAIANHEKRIQKLQLGRNPSLRTDYL